MRVRVRIRVRVRVRVGVRVRDRVRDRVCVVTQSHRAGARFGSKRDCLALAQT